MCFKSRSSIFLAVEKASAFSLGLFKAKNVEVLGINPIQKESDDFTSKQLLYFGFADD